MAPRPLGKFEFDLITFVAEGGEMTIRDIYEGFGKPNSYIRGTIVKGMDRLLKKGLVSRVLADGVFVYAANRTKEDLDRQLVENFVRDRLGGRVAPIATFLTESSGLSSSELQLLLSSIEKKQS